VSRDAQREAEKPWRGRADAHRHAASGWQTLNEPGAVARGDAGGGLTRVCASTEGSSAGEGSEVRGSARPVLGGCGCDQEEGADCHGADSRHGGDGVDGRAAPAGLPVTLAEGA
jgi:hypothetical protein